MVARFSDADLRLLRVFATVAECKGFAAERDHEVRIELTIEAPQDLRRGLLDGRLNPRRVLPGPHRGSHRPGAVP
jgi:hypothetical protein